MKIIDLHTDTLTCTSPEEADYFLDNTMMVNYNLMRKGGYKAVAAAVFLDMADRKDLFATAVKYFDALDRIVASHPEEVKFYDGVDDGRIQFIRTIEEGEIIEGDISKLEYLRSRGLRMMTLTWNHPNSLAFPNRPRPGENAPELTHGLTSKGVEVLRYLDKNHILFDVSHLGDKCFYDALEHYHGPIVASHSNARSVTPVVRNLTDEMIKIIAEFGGVIGLNLCEYFVKAEGRDYTESLIAHLEHIRRIGGVDVLALGSDYDGIDVPPALASCDRWSELFERLKARGWSETDLEKLSHRNAERVLAWSI